MSISRTSTLSEPTGTDKVPLSTLAYFRARFKQRMYNLIIREFKKSGLSQADLARRLDKEPAQLSRLLSGPGNLTLETVSDVMFASNSAEPNLSASYPLSGRQGAPETELVQEVSSEHVKPASASAIPLRPASALGTESSAASAIIEELKKKADTPILAAA